MPPRIIKDIFFSVEEDEHQAKVSSAEIVQPKPVVWRGGDPATVYADIPAGGTMLNLVFVQDWEDASGLCQYLNTNQGQIGEVIFSPRAAGTAYMSVQAIFAAPNFGGKVNEFGESTLQLECVGAPTPTTAPV